LLTELLADFVTFRQYVFFKQDPDTFKIAYLKNMTKKVQISEQY